MEFEIQSLTKDCISFCLYETDVSIANALRRILMSEIPTMAIEFVLISENSTVYNDEYIAHRLGLIPLAISPTKFVYSQDCTCVEAGCEQCSILFSLDVDCDSNGKYSVTTNNLQVQRSTSVDLFGPLEFPIPIVELKRGQSLHLTALAVKGLASSHAKWGPTTAVAYKIEPRITINPEIARTLSQQDQQKIVDCCPLNVFTIARAQTKIQDLEDLEDLRASNHWNCTLCRKCIDVATTELKTPNLLSIDGSHQEDKTNYQFKVETTGALPPKEVMNLAFLSLKQKLQMWFYSFQLDDK